MMLSTQVVDTASTSTEIQVMFFIIEPSWILIIIRIQTVYVSVFVHLIEDISLRARSHDFKLNRLWYINVTKLVFNAVNVDILFNVIQFFQQLRDSLSVVKY